MRPKSMHTWVSHEMERLSNKFERYKPSGSGYNRIKPVVLSKSVTHMLNNPLPAEHQIGRNSMLTAPTRDCDHDQQKQQQQQQRHLKARGVLSRSQSEWEEVYPAVLYGRHHNNAHEQVEGTDANKTFVFYRSCSTRIT